MCVSTFFSSSLFAVLWNYKRVSVVIIINKSVFFYQQNKIIVGSITTNIVLL